MKRQFECMLILLLMFAFVSCPAFIGRASAENGKSSNQSGQRAVVKAALQLAGMGDFVDDYPSNLPASVDDLINLVTNSEIAKKIQDFRQNRSEARTEKVNKLKSLFGGGLDSGD
jgi:hypothetical protein